MQNPAEVMPGIAALLRENWSETGFGFEFAPDAGTYQRAVDLGVMFIIAAYDDPHLIGYCTMTVTPHLHNPAIKVAVNDALFVRPDRRGYAAGRLMLEAEREAVRRGATQVVWRTRIGTDLPAALAKRGYVPVDIGMLKELNHGT
jgi:GNAT superfamily N-acetyltransferase